MKIVNYTLKKASSGIFVVVVEDSYERAMLFLRCQEFYESPFPQFKGKHFDVFEYMNYYKKQNAFGYFSYTQDWVGFNVPGDIVEECTNYALDDNSDISSTPYDYVMKEIIDTVKGQLQDENRWYLIGVNGEEGRIIEHEISHGLFYVNSDYKEKATSLVRSLPESVFNNMSHLILSMGYCEEVIDDEIQAYLSTGVTPSMSQIPGISNYCSLFESNLKGFL
jgi:hypothetical protein